MKTISGMWLEDMTALRIVVRAELNVANGEIRPRRSRFFLSRAVPEKRSRFSECGDLQKCDGLQSVAATLRQPIVLKMITVFCFFHFPSIVSGHTPSVTLHRLLFLPTTTALAMLCCAKRVNILSPFFFPAPMNMLELLASS